MTETYSLGEWVRRQRRAQDMAQRELAARAGCAVATIKKIEADERRPSVELARLLAEALRVPADLHDVFVECARGLRPVDALWSVEAAQGNVELRFPSPFAALPVPATPFVGRVTELAQIADLLARPAC